MPAHDVVVLGGSAGALQALSEIVARLPSSFPACLLVVVHTSAEGNGLLPNILERFTSLPVSFARNHDPIVPGHVYVAMPDFHLVVTSSGLRVVHGPSENGFRPAIDPLFRTAAREFGSRVIGVILSGGLSDGTYGLSVVKQCGGVTIVQDPDDAIVTSLPENAIRDVEVDYVRKASEIGTTVERLVVGQLDQLHSPAEGDSQMAGSKDVEPQLPVENTEVAEMTARFGPPSALTCPDCGGALWEVEDGRILRYQCHVGHQYAPDALENGQRAAIDNALWTAVRVLEEHADMKGRLARRAAGNGLEHVSAGFAQGARDAHGHAQTIRSLLFGAASNSPAAVEAQAEAEEGRRTTQKTERAAEPSQTHRKVHRNFNRARRRN